MPNRESLRLEQPKHMNTAPLYLGIDFGTTNSSLAYVYRDPRFLNAQSIPVATLKLTMDEENDILAERMPTLLSTRFDDRRAKGFLTGWEVFRQFGRRKKSPLLRRGRELFDSVKSDLGSHRIYANAGSADCNTPQKVAGAILRSLIDEARKKLPRSFQADQTRTVITVPASLNAEARRETRAAAVAAGLNGELIELIDEPVAALLHLLNEQTAAAILSMEEPRNVLVFDYGGGTLDLCLVKCSFNHDSKTGLQAETLAISQYRRNGGNDVDRAIIDEVIWPQLEEQLGEVRADMPADLRRSVEDTFTSTLARELKEKLCRKITKQIEQGIGFSRIQPGLNETAKLDGDFEDDRLAKPIRGRFKMTKTQLDEVMEPFLRVPSAVSELSSDDYSHSLIAPIWDCLAKAGLAPEDLDVLVLHGGSCRNPYVREQLRQLLKDEGSQFSHTTIVETPNLDTSVACGAALACYWKHERGVELIKPVTAEDIGIITLGDSPVCLLESGTPLPFPTAGVHEHPTDFYVAQNGQSELIIPFYAGRTEGKPRLSGTVKVPLPGEVRKGDVIRLKLNIDKDKIMHWWYRVADGDFIEADPLNDPWTPKQLSPAERRLLAFRREMEDKLNSGAALPDWMLTQEASLCHSAGALDEAELQLLDFAGSREITYRAANLLSLVSGEQGNDKDKLRYAQDAARLDPTNAVLAGNLGCVWAEAGLTDQGIAQMRLALGMDPKLTYLYERLGNICRQRGDEAGACREFTQAIQILERASCGSPQTAHVWSDLARLYQKMGDYSQAASARSRAADAHQNEIYDGDHRHRIAGPDSGFLPSN